MAMEVIKTTVTTEKRDEAVRGMTCAEAAIRYPGATERQFNRMCLRGKRMKRLFGDTIPPEEKQKCLFAKRVGKYWFIPVAELDRVYLP